jgi:hypothetical protein
MYDIQLYFVHSLQFFPRTEQEFNLYFPSRATANLIATKVHMPCCIQAYRVPYVWCNSIEIFPVAWQRSLACGHRRLQEHDSLTNSNFIPCRYLQFAPENILTCWRMVSSGMLRRVALVRTDVSEELSASFIRVTRIGELGTTLAVTSNRRACVGC